MKKISSFLLVIGIVIESILGLMAFPCVCSAKEDAYFLTAYTVVDNGKDKEAKQILVGFTDYKNKTYVSCDDIESITGMKSSLDSFGTPVFSYGEHSVTLSNEKVDYGGKVYYPLKDTMDRLQTSYTVNENGEIIFMPCTSFMENLTRDVEDIVWGNEADFNVNFFENTWGIGAATVFRVLLETRVDYITGNYQKEQYEKAIAGIVSTFECDNEIIDVISDGDKTLSSLYRIGSLKFSEEDTSLIENWDFLGYETDSFLEAYHEYNKAVPGFTIGDYIGIIKHIYATQHASELFINAVKYGLVSSGTYGEQLNSADADRIHYAAVEILDYYDKNKTTEEIIMKDYVKNFFKGVDNRIQDKAKEFVSDLLGKTLSVSINGAIIKVFADILEVFGVTNGPKVAEQGVIASKIQRAAMSKIRFYSTPQKNLVDKNAPYYHFPAGSAVRLKYSTILYVKACNYAYSLCKFDKSLEDTCTIMNEKTNDAIKRLAQYDDEQLERVVDNKIILLSDVVSHEIQATDLSFLLGKSIEEAKKLFPNMEVGETQAGIYYFDTNEDINGRIVGQSFYVDSDGIINSIFLDNKNNIEGIWKGMSIKEALTIAKERGWEFYIVGFAHGTANYYAEMRRGSDSLVIMTDTEGIFGESEESDLKGNVESVCISREGEDTVTSKVTDVFEYFKNYEDLVSKLDMKWIPAWQFGGENSYTSSGFYLEYIKDDWIDDFCMKNEGSPYVSFCGIMLGDKLDVIPEKLTGRGWKFFSDCDKYVEYYLTRDDGIYIVMFYKDSEGKVASWYANNWPEGEDYMYLE